KNKIQRNKMFLKRSQHPNKVQDKKNRNKESTDWNKNKSKKRSQHPIKVQDKKKTKQRINGLE
ncbi:hypothetical protein HELRODRAFT_87122, partial [Helobdella robusta]|uniref:Uncharacterized protein n=1 Tax=Helobdella robusta TaxID=6412 RepID=T1G6L9_HELRO